MGLRQRVSPLSLVLGVLCAVLAALLSVSIAVLPAHAAGTAAGMFVDSSPDDEVNHGPDVEWLAEQGISIGWPRDDGGAEFRGSLSVARCDMASFLYRLADLRDDGIRDDSIALSQADEDAWLGVITDCDADTPHAPEIAWLASVGITRGWAHDDGTFEFRPLQNVARQDMAAFLYRLADWLDGDGFAPAYGSDPLEFVDVFPGSSASHASEVRWLASWGISRGWVTSDATYEFRGLTFVARQDMAAFLHRLYDVLGSEGSSQPIVDPDPGDDPVPDPDPTGTLVVHFIDVGQGDAEFIEFPDGRTMLVDAGTEGSGSTVVAYVASLGYSAIDYVVATHPHADHIGGMPAVFAAFEIGQVWAPRATANTMTFEAFLDAVAEEGTGIEPAYAGEVIGEATGGYSVEVLGPPEDLGTPGDLNDSSVILRIEYEGTSFLLVGDAPVGMIYAAWCQPVDVLKVGHHGSSTSTNYELAAALSPRYAVISYGAGNSYGHPHAATLEALRSVGASLFGTAANGTVVASVSDGDLYLVCEREGDISTGGA